MANILVTDDDQDVRELVAFVLEKEGHRVTKAQDGQGCLDHVNLEKPDLIVLDVMMPGMDGYTVHSKLAENDETRDIPILILTAKGGMQDVFQLAANVKGYIAKPFDPNALREKVGKILGSR
jgi:CheY-like chemotaxis protein